MNETRTVIAQAVRAQCSESVTSITRLHGGVVNQVFSVTTEHRRYVIRLNENSLAVFEKEQWAMAKAAHKQVRVPQVFCVGEIDGVSYMLMEQAPGVMLSEYDGDRNRVLTILGEQLRRLHEVEVEGFGFDLNLADKNRPHFTMSWAEVVSGEHAMTFANPSLVAMGALTEKEVGTAIEFLRPMSTWKHTPVICHGDVNPNNVLVDEAGDVTVLDWTGTRGGPGIIFDLSSLAMKNPVEFDYLCQGYGLSAERKEMLRIQWQQNALKDVLRGAAWAYGVKHKQLEKFAKDVRDMYRKIIPN